MQLRLALHGHFTGIVCARDEERTHLLLEGVELLLQLILDAQVESSESLSHALGKLSHEAAPFGLRGLLIERRQLREGLYERFARQLGDSEVAQLFELLQEQELCSLGACPVD
jgi:hypothetical protein